MKYPKSLQGEQFFDEISVFHWCKKLKFIANDHTTTSLYNLKYDGSRVFGSTNVTDIFIAPCWIRLVEMYLSYKNCSQYRPANYARHVVRSIIWVDVLTRRKRAENKSFPLCRFNVVIFFFFFTSVKVRKPPLPFRNTVPCGFITWTIFFNRSHISSKLKFSLFIIIIFFLATVKDNRYVTFYFYDEWKLQQY